MYRQRTQLRDVSTFYLYFIEHIKLLFLIRIVEFPRRNF